MELDMYEVYEMLRKNPQIELKIDVAPTLDGLYGLQIKVINYDDITQKYVILSKNQMIQMRGAKPLMDIISNMIKTVANGEGY